MLLLLSIAQLMVILDISAVNVALPDLAADLGIARADIGDAFLVAAALAGAAGVVALIVLPSARHFLPKLALAPRLAVH